MYVGRCVTWSHCPVMGGRWSGDLGADKFMRGAFGEGYSCAGGGVNAELQLSCQLFVLQLALQPLWWNQRQLSCDTTRRSNHLHPRLSVVCGKGQRHRAEAKIAIKAHQIFIWQKAPSPWVHPHRVLQHTTKRHAPKKNNNKKTMLWNQKNLNNYSWPYIRQHFRATATSESLHATNDVFIADVSHLAYTMEHQQCINGHINLRTTMTSSDWPHSSICWVNSKLSIKTPSMNPARPIWTAIRSQMCLVLLVGQ